jgi:hypothetical protein
MTDFSSKDINKIDELYKSILNEQSDVSKEWEKGAKQFSRWTDRNVSKYISAPLKSASDYAGQAASGVVRAATDGAVDLEKIGKSAEKLLGSGGKGRTTKPQEPEKPAAVKQHKPEKLKVGPTGGLKVEGWGPFLSQQEKDAINAKAIKGYKSKSKPTNTRIAAPKGGDLGTQEPGKPSTWKPSTDPELLKRYKEKRGPSQLKTDKQLNKDVAAMNRQIAATPPGKDPEFYRSPVQKPPVQKPPVTSAPTRPSLSPAVKTSPQPKIEKSPAGYAVGSVGGVKFERRAATSAELKAAQAAREAAKVSGESKPKQELSAVKAGVQASKVKKEEYDAYDLVLEYLLSQGHVETVEEALYVMMEMDAEVIQDIVSEAAEPRGGGSAPNVPPSVYKFVDELPSKIQGFMKGKPAPAPAPKPATK